MTPKELIELVQRLPNSDHHIHEHEGKHHLTSEWLVGTLAGCSFPCDTLEESAQKMIDYLKRHRGHDSIVGRAVTESGFPNLKMVEKYCRAEEDY